MTIVQFPTKITALRQQLRRNGFHPLPTYARQQLSEALPIRYPFMPDWFETDDEDIRHWEHDHRATATAVAAKFAPALFIRCNIEAAAEAAEEVVREHFEKRGDTCVCLRWPTQRLILMRTNEPFAKSSRTFFSPNDDEHQVEIFGDGQMYIVDGQVENLLTIQHKNLPGIQHSDTEQLVDAIGKLWVEKFGFVRDNPTTRLQWIFNNVRKAEARLAAYKGPDENTLPPDTLREIQDPHSKNLWNVLMVLKNKGYTINSSIALFEKYPNGMNATYRGRLRYEVERAFDKIRVNPTPTTPEAPPSPVFDPWQRYIVPAFPLDILPPVAQDYVQSQSAIIGCDISGLAMCVLSTFSGALHHSFALKMQRHNNWHERPRLWLLNVADPSQRKTPTLKAATHPIVDYEIYLREKYEAELRPYEEAVAQGKEKDQLPQKPKEPPRYVVWDTSVEKLGELLARNPKGLLVLSDEISFWLGSMERYSNSAGRSDRGFWLTAYDGGPHNVDRIKRGSFHIKNLSVSLLGCIQPERLAEMQGLTSDGLLQRFIPVMWGPAAFTQDRPSNDEAYAKLVRVLIFAKPARLIMTDDALAIMDDLRSHLFKIEQTSSGLAAGFQSWVGKLHGIAGSLALILHMAHDPELGATYAVEANTMEDARKLMLDFILPHGYEFYQQGGGTERLRRLASWILTSDKQRVLSSDITKNVADCRGLTLRELQERLSPLVAAGWLEPETKTPSCNAWRVAPQVHIQLAERAKIEAERKTKLIALMKSTMSAPENTE
jgi:hypothetical protein